MNTMPSPAEVMPAGNYGDTCLDREIRNSVEDRDDEHHAIPR